jgi:hypothetical protein
VLNAVFVLLVTILQTEPSPIATPWAAKIIPIERPARIKPYSIAEAAALSRKIRSMMDRWLIAVSDISNQVGQLSSSIANILLRQVK